MSPFTRALLDCIETPGLEVTDMMRLVRRKVRDATQGRQIPWSNESLTSPFYFASPPADEHSAKKSQPLLGDAQATLGPEIFLSLPTSAGHSQLVLDLDDLPGENFHF